MEKRKKIVAFDMDNVLGDLVEGMSIICSDMVGRAVLPSEIVRYNYHRQLGISDEDFLKAHIEYKTLENIKIYSDAKESIDRLRAHDFLTVVVSSRGFHPDAAIITHNTLKQHELEMDHICLVDIYETKIAALQSLQQFGDIVAYIDDYQDHLHILNEVDLGSCELFLMDKMWNRDESKFTRLSSLTEYADLIINKHITECV